MDKERREKYLHALASGKETSNTPLIEAYLADEDARKVAKLLEEASGRHQLGKTPLLPPSSCLPMLD